MLPLAFRAAVLHLAIVAGTITYAYLGAVLFLYLEGPSEIALRLHHLTTYEKIQLKFLQTVAVENITEEYLYVSTDNYIEELLNFYEDSQSARIFEAHYLASEVEDQWTIASSILFAATTIIPVGYGFVAPVTKTGRFVVVIYALIGAPLVLVTITDIGKFLSFYFTRFFPESITKVCFLTLLLVYLFVGALLFSLFSHITYLEAVYFSITSVFTIGYGDTKPPISVSYLILYIIIGVILVTITVEMLASEAINHIHYMGRHIGKAKQIARKIARVVEKRPAFNIHLKRMESLVRFGMLLDLLKTETTKERNMMELCKISTPFAPQFDDIEFADAILPERFSVQQ